MADRTSGEFYVGYRAQAPPAIAARTRRAVAAAMALAAVVALLLVTSQAGFAPAVFEFGRERDLEGLFDEIPYPSLSVDRPGVTPPGEWLSRYLLVGPGKHGLQPPPGLAGSKVRLRGTLAYREGGTLVEVAPGSVQELGPAHLPLEAAGSRNLGVGTFVGEIVDSKCYLGVMNPGQGKTHRACAARCISGGIPPILVTRDRTGEVAHLLLVSPEGRPVNREVLDLVGEPVQVRGSVVRQGERLVLRADPSTFRRIAGEGE